MIRVPRHDPYRILGVKPTDTLQTIKQRFKQLVRRWHPDRPAGDAQMFNEIQNAYRKVYTKRQAEERLNISKDRYLRERNIGTQPIQPPSEITKDFNKFYENHRDRDVFDVGREDFLKAPVVETNKDKQIAIISEPVSFQSEAFCSNLRKHNETQRSDFSTYRGTKRNSRTIACCDVLQAFDPDQNHLETRMGNCRKESSLNSGSVQKYKQRRNRGITQQERQQEIIDRQFFRVTY